jgi:hypothetical protein
LVLSYPFTVGAPPRANAVRSVKREYAIRLGVFAIAVPVACFGAATCAFLLSRRIREQYATEQLQNLADLLTSIPEAKKNDRGAE